jgi:hypothetical protein
MALQGKRVIPGHSDCADQQDCTAGPVSQRMAERAAGDWLTVSPLRRSLVTEYIQHLECKKIATAPVSLRIKF